MRNRYSELPYSSGVLAPYISRETVEYHYEKHQKGYADKLSSLTAGTRFEDLPLIDIVRNSEGSMFYNAAQTWNHEFYWKSLTPKIGMPHGALLTAIKNTFFTVNGFNDVFHKRAEGIFGSGWIWLVANRNGEVSLEASANADTPIKGSSIPLLAIDIWEHAYYLDYKNERSKYASSVLEILNWEFAEQNYTDFVGRIYERRIAQEA